MRVHRNLHNARRGGPQWVITERGRVVEYVEALTLVNVSTRLQRGGVAKCAEKQVRSVCAYFDGDESLMNGKRKGYSSTTDECGFMEWQRVAFDPRKDSEFLADGNPWNHATAVTLNADGSCYALNPTWKD